MRGIDCNVAPSERSEWGPLNPGVVAVR